MQDAAQQVAVGSSRKPSAGAQAGAASVAPAIAATPGSLRREIFGFALASTLADPTVGYPSWNFSLLSTVAFFGLHINDDGTIASDAGLTEWNSSDLTNLVATAHAAHAKVVVTIIEQDSSSGTPHMCAALANRATTVTQTASQVSAKGVDGVNIDYEGLNGTCPNGSTARSMVTDFARQMRAGLPAGSYLSIDTYASSAADSLGFFDIAGLNPYVDAFFAMAYDLEYSNYAYTPPGCSAMCLGPTAPLAGYHYTDTSTANQYSAVVPASKVILGVPYYGRKACVASATANQYPTDAITADTYLDAVSESSQPQVQSGSYAVHRDANDPAGQERWDTWFNTSLNCNRELYWDDTISLGKKYDLANADGLRGVGIWNLNYGGGASELWSSLYTHFAACTSAALATAPASPSTVGASVSLTASSTGCPNPEYRFFIQRPGGSWTATTGFGPNTWTWSTAGLAPGIYGVGVWVREAGSGATYDAYFLGTFTVTSAACASASLAPGTAPPLDPGPNVNFTATPTGCANAEYKFWLLAPGGTWKLARDWGPATWTWATANAAKGTYQVGVWARQVGSTASYEAYAITTYTLGTSGCSSAALTPSPSSPAVAGTAVTATASAGGCTNPQYEFWLLKPGATWTVGQAYGGASAWTWSTQGLAPGTYQLGVWARQQGSTAAYDAYFIITYQLLPATCSAATMTVAPASPEPAGTSVTLAATATGCSDPRFEFWVLPPPGTTWKILAPYQTGSTLPWNTSGLAPGPYRIGVWARQNGSSATYDTYSIVTFWVGA